MRKLLNEYLRADVLQPLDNRTYILIRTLRTNHADVFVRDHNTMIFYSPSGYGFHLSPEGTLMVKYPHACQASILGYSLCAQSEVG